MNTTPLVSVVIPTYNAPDLLAEALRSVFAQTFGDYEVIVVNDGSTDDTLARLEAFAGRVRLIDQENRGIGAARDRGIAEARGKYVALLDHDDLWLPGKLAAQVEYLEAHPRCAAASVPFSYSTSPAAPAFDAAAVAGADGVVRRPLRQLTAGQMFLMSSSLMFAREKARGLRHGARRQCIEDMPFQIGLFARGDVAVAGDRVLMVYRVHPGNYSSQALYYANGIRLLREMARREAFGPLGAADRRDLRAYLAHIGRTAAVRQLLAGERRRGAAVYLEELPFQAREGRLKFLATFPFLLALPRRTLARMFPLSGSSPAG